MMQSTYKMLWAHKWKKIILPREGEMNGYIYIYIYGSRKVLTFELYLEKLGDFLRRANKESGEESCSR